MVIIALRASNTVYANCMICILSTSGRLVKWEEGMTEYWLGGREMVRPVLLER